MRNRRLLLSLVLPMVLVLVGVGAWYAFDQPRGHAAAASNVPIANLPKGATDINYLLPGALGPCLVYEFNVTEPEFDAWVGAMRPAVTPSKASSIRCLDQSGWPQSDHEISDGRVLDQYNQDRGVRVAFDRRIGRAFYFQSFR